METFYLFLFLLVPLVRGNFFDTIEKEYKNVKCVLLEHKESNTVARIYPDTGGKFSNTNKDVGCADAVDKEVETDGNDYTVAEISQKGESTMVEADDMNSLDVQGCTCGRYDCGCCIPIDIKAFELDSEACVDVTYIPAPEYGVAFSIKIGSKIIFKESVSARNPPPLCVDVPEFKELASLCLKFSKLTLTEMSFSGCLSLEAHLIKVFQEDFHLSCFKFHPNGAKMGRVKK